MRTATLVVPTLMLFSIACGNSGSPPPTAAPTTTAAVLTGDEVRNATYTGLADEVAEVTLADGRWEGDPYVEGGASRPRVQLLDGLLLAGDVDGDGFDEAVVMLAQHGGGTGEYLHLAVVDRAGGVVRNTATALVGDRVQIRRAAVDAGTVVLDVVQAGGGDAMCCPGDLVTRRWTLGPDGLTELEPVATGRLGPDTLAGSEWVLTGWGMDEPAAADPEITIAYEDGRFAGSSGCNRYFAAVSSGDAPGDLRLGPVGGTRMACPDDVMTVETRYLTRLGAVTKMSFVAGRLVLTTVHDGTVGTLVYEQRGPSHGAGSD